MIDEEKLDILKEISKGSNIFVTGNAGTGKSYLISLIKEFFLGGLSLTASTGIAAVNINGLTLHSWCGIGRGTEPVDLVFKFISSFKGVKVRKRIRNTKVLVIDEISMISSQTLDLVNDLLKLVRGSNQPFGGIQVILIGDFLQLPPVVDYGSNIEHCFNSRSWKEARFRSFILKKTYRQSDNRLINLLNNIRFGKLTEEDKELIKSRTMANYPSDINPTLIVTHNNQANLVNSDYLNNLQSNEHKFIMKLSGKDSALEFLKRNSPVPEMVILKLNAQVMMLKNTYQSEGIINGSIGKVISFNSKGLPLVKFKNGVIKTIEYENWIYEEFDLELNKMVEKAKISQLPLNLAWAITVHKSQGMTLDAIECDLSKVFVEGQVYVALSRVKTLEGLFIKNFNPNLIKSNNNVIDFYKGLSELVNY